MIKSITGILLVATFTALLACTADSVGNRSAKSENSSPRSDIQSARPTAEEPTAEANLSPEERVMPANTAPDELVKDLYKQHDTEGNPFFQYQDRSLVDAYFTRATADLIWKDAVQSKGEVGALGADPLYDAQDTEITNFKVGPADIKGDSATVTVTFENFRKKQTIKYQLARENGEWKIADIIYAEYTLLKLYRENS